MAHLVAITGKSLPPTYGEPTLTGIGFVGEEKYSPQGVLGKLLHLWECTLRFQWLIVIVCKFTEQQQCSLTACNMRLCHARGVGRSGFFKLCHLQ